MSGGGKTLDELNSRIEGFLEVKVLSEVPVHILQQVSVDELAHETFVLHFVHVELGELGFAFETALVLLSFVLGGGGDDDVGGNVNADQ